MKHVKSHPWLRRWAGMLMVLGLAGSGCLEGSDDLVGTWRLTSVHGVGILAHSYEEGMDVVLTLRQDGTATSRATHGERTEIFNGTWSATETTITFSYEEHRLTVRYTLVENTLTITSPTGDVTVWER